MFDASAVTVTEWPIAAPGAREDQEGRTDGAVFDTRNARARSAQDAHYVLHSNSRFAEATVVYLSCRNLDSRDVLTLPFSTERIMLMTVLILAAAATAACGIVIIIAGIVAARSPIRATPRRRAF